MFATGFRVVGWAAQEGQYRNPGRSWGRPHLRSWFNRVDVRSVHMAARNDVAPHLSRPFFATCRKFPLFRRMGVGGWAGWRYPLTVVGCDLSGACHLQQICQGSHIAARNLSRVAPRRLSWILLSKLLAFVESAGAQSRNSSANPRPPCTFPESA